MSIKRAAVIGAGTMGSQIAAHLANAGIPTLLLDIVPSDLTDEERAKGLDETSPQYRNRLARVALELMPKSRLAPFYDPADVDLITPGNLEDDFPKLADVDWVIEAVVERLDIKRDLFARLEGQHRGGQIISSNTSGLPLGEITRGCGERFLRHVMITHFFNPPRYMRLLELVATNHTDAELFAAVKRFCEQRLGKGVVIAKDTPNFIANRIGVFDMNLGLRLSREMGLTPEVVDAVAGPIMGRPKSGIFRLIDLVGVDIAQHVSRNLYETLEEDEQREVFEPDPLLERMIDQGLLGDKSGGGFYRKARNEQGEREIRVLDKESLEYRSRKSEEIEALAQARKARDPQARLQALIDSQDAAGQFAWRLVSGTLCYAANRLPEIADDILSVDQAMRWGFNWQMGPFELWDALGVEKVAGRLDSEQREVPAIVRQLLDAGQSSFYSVGEGRRRYFDIAAARPMPIERPGNVLILDDLKAAGQVVRPGKSASILDLGEGVYCVEFHSKVNALDRETLEMIHGGIELAETQGQALVLGNEGANFSVGADLAEAMQMAEAAGPQIFDQLVRDFQAATTALKYCRVPTVAALHGMALGGGCELAMHCDRIQCAPETYVGLVEMGVGLIPAGGGCREWAIRIAQQAGEDLDLFPLLNEALMLIGLAKVSTSAAEAFKLGYLRRGDGITMNLDAVIHDARALAVQLASEGYRPPRRAKAIRVLGRDGIAEFRVRLNIMRKGNYISEYDEVVANKLAWVLCGGDVPKHQKVDEQWLLDLEREAFTELLNKEKTRQRIDYMLKTGKPLRN